jgi:hypothetical protein
LLRIAADDDRRLPQSRQARRPAPPFPGDDHIAAVFPFINDDGLYDSVLFDRCGQFFQFRLIKTPAGLSRIGG